MSEHMEWLEDQIKAEVQGKLKKAVELLEELEFAVAFNRAFGMEVTEELKQKQYEVYLFLESIKS